MGVDVTVRGATRNQSTADFTVSRIFIFDNRFVPGTFKNTGATTINLKSGYLAARAAGTYETATATFVALTTGQTMIIAGLTYTSTAATTAAQLAAAFANLDAGSTTGAGTATGTYSGTLTAYSTGPATDATVTFTSLTTGSKTDLVATGTGTTPTWVYVQGSATLGSGFIPVTSSNLADVIGVVAIEGVNGLGSGDPIACNICTKGTIDGNLLTLPAGVTLETIVGTKELRDVLESLGLHVDTSTVENTKFDN